MNVLMSGARTSTSSACAATSTSRSRRRALLRHVAGQSALGGRGSCRAQAARLSRRDGGGSGPRRGLAGGVTGLIAVNNRAGGHAGPRSGGGTSTQELAVLGPVVCAGASGRDRLVAALRNGLCRRALGTRFIATNEWAPRRLQAGDRAGHRSRHRSHRACHGVPLSVIRTA